MRISIIYISSVMQRSKKLEIRNTVTVKIPKGLNIECRKIESNPSKERAMHVGDTTSFQDEFIQSNFS
jgi:hypothetical protein